MSVSSRTPDYRICHGFVTPKAKFCILLRKSGAGDGNRTHLAGLGSRCITTMLRPLFARTRGPVPTSGTAHVYGLHHSQRTAPCKGGSRGLESASPDSDLDCVLPVAETGHA